MAHRRVDDFGVATEQAVDDALAIDGVREGLTDLFVLPVRQAQVDDTLARLYLEQKRFDLATESVTRAIETLQQGDEDPLLAEVLRTKGIICCRLERFSEAGRIFERAHDVASRCGDREGAGRALLIMVEQMGTHLTAEESHDIGVRVRILLSESQQATTRTKLKRALQTIKEQSRSL